MFRFRAKAFFFVSATISVAVLGAATPTIGVAISDGSIRINEARTAGNASVFNGTKLETDRPAQVRLNAGGSLQFGNASKAQLFSDHIDLQAGSARFSGLSATANGLSVRPDADSSADVQLHGKVVQVAALTGKVRVFNQKGVNVANLLPGRALNLTPQDAGAAAAASMTGCVTGANGMFTLLDETSNVTVELRGANVRPGHRVQVTGTMVANSNAPAGAPQVVAVTNVKELGGGCAASASKANSGAGSAAGPGAGQGHHGGGAAVIAGVTAAAAAGVGIGIAATHNDTGVVSNGGAASSGTVINPGCQGISPCTN